MPTAQVSRQRRLEIRPGAQVISGDLQVGRVERLIYRPGTQELAGIVVSGWLVLSHPVYIPSEAIIAADPDAVWVALGPDELERLPPADGGRIKPTGDFRRPAASGQMPVHDGGRPLRAGQKVVATDGDAGRLDLVLVDPRTGRASGLVIRKGRILTRDVVVPTDLVRSVERNEIVLAISRAELDRLPEYRPDEEITRDVVDALWYRADLRPADVQFVHVQTRDGVVELTGHTHTEATKKRIEQVAHEVNGVLHVNNFLDTFEALEAAVRAAKARQGRLAGDTEPELVD
jgi:hypothetical protein